jgi:hypothetical protein
LASKGGRTFSRNTFSISPPHPAKNMVSDAPALAAVTIKRDPTILAYMCI